MRLAMVMAMAAWTAWTAWTAAGQVFPPPPTGGAQSGAGGEAMPPAPGPLYGAVRAAGTVRAGDAVVWGDAQGRTITGADMENSAWASTGMVAAAVAAATAGMASTQYVAVSIGEATAALATTGYVHAAGAAVSNALAQADAAHAAQRNPHGITAADIGAITNETDEAALAAMPFNLFDATKNVIWKGAGTNANTTQSILIGDRAGNAATGSTIIAIGRDAARDILNPAIVPEAELSVIAIGENAAEQAGGMATFSYNIAIGNSAFKEGAGQSSIAIGQDALDKSPGAFTSIAIGREAGRTAAAEQMIAIGYQAGEQAGLTNSVVIGANAGRRASGQNILVIDSSGNDDSDYPARAMIYGNANDLTLGRIDSDNSLRGNWLLNNNRILTNEQDLAALRTYHYGSPDIVESPEEWFSFNPDTGTITGFNWQAGRENVVIPWQIGGVSVVKLDGFLCEEEDRDRVISVIAPKCVDEVSDSFIECSALTSVSLPNVTTVNYSFEWCSALTSVSLPNATTVNYSFYYCSALTSVTFSGSPPEINEYTFYDSPNVTVYVDNPQATGWGATFDGRPVVRPNLYADNLYQGGERAATENYVDQRIGAIPGPSPYLPQLNAGTNLAVRLVASNDWIMAIGEIK